MAPAAPKPRFSRKDRLAEWITRADNPFFARAIANRVWAQYLGRGLVHPLDLDHPANPPSHPELLALLADEIGATKFDVRHFLRDVVRRRGL